jgi:hypothetical protein
MRVSTYNAHARPPPSTPTLRYQKNEWPMRTFLSARLSNILDNAQWVNICTHTYMRTSTPTHSTQLTHSLTWINCNRQSENSSSDSSSKNATACCRIFMSANRESNNCISFIIIIIVIVAVIVLLCLHVLVLAYLKRISWCNGSP